MSNHDSNDRREGYKVTVPLRRPRFMGRDTLPKAHRWGPIEFIDLSAAHIEPAPSRESRQDRLA